MSPDQYKTRFGDGRAKALTFNTSFDAGRYDSQEMAGWQPARAHMDSVFAGSGRLIVDRAEDLDRNSAWVNGALDRAVESIIGNGLQPWPTPVYEALGKDVKWAADYSRKLRARYRVWAEDPYFRCDARMRLSLGSLTRLAYLSFRRGGEAVAEIRKDNRGATNRTNVLLIDPKRISQPRWVPETDPRIRNGIESNAAGVPIAAHVLRRHPDDPGPWIDATLTDRITFRTRTGTPKLIHVINPRYIEQSRGFSQLVESMLPAKMLERYDRAEINAALLNAILAVFIKSPGTPEDLSAAIAPGSGGDVNNALTDYVQYRTQNPIAQIGDAMIRQLLPDEDIETVQPTHPNANYPEFQKTQLSKIAASHGLSYAQISQNWADINYSSARAMLNEVWRGIKQEREFFAAHFSTPILVAWLEEEVAQGTIRMPGGPARFYRDTSALTNTTWIGPSRGTVDPQKEATARNLEEAAHRTSPIENILEDGRDPFEVLDQIALFRAAIADRGLEEPDYNTKGSADAGASDDGTANGTEQDRDADGIPLEDKKKKGAPAKPKGNGQ